MLRKVLDIQIGERMVDLEIKKNRDLLGVTEADVDRAIDEVLRMNRLSKEQLVSALYAQGMTEQEYRSSLKSQIERARLIQQKVQGKVEVTDLAVSQRCKERQASGLSNIEVCASHILFQVDNDASGKSVEKLRHKASKIQAELVNGADFAAYALKYSEDKNTPDGSLGCFGRGEMFKNFEQAAFSTKVGDVSNVVRTQLGFHIIKVTERRTPATNGCETEAHLAPFRNEIYQEEMETQMKHWMELLRKRFFVDVRLQG